MANKKMAQCRTHYLTKELYAPQTKILEGGTKEEIRIFEALFKDVSTKFGPLTIERVNRNPDFLFCSSFQNLRLGSIKIERNHRILF